MAILVVGLIVFIGMHALPWHTGLRTQVVNKLGANTYRALFSVVAVAGLVLIIVGKARADFQSIVIRVLIHVTIGIDKQRMYLSGPVDFDG